MHLDENLKKIISASNKLDSTVLLMGETGSGKSHLAKIIHDLSNRNLKKFVTVNLGSMSESLIESELFGHEKGSFTGADHRRVGKLEFANGGTVFLDEIGEMPIHVQSKILDFIQKKVIYPLGSNREIELDVRIIAATNKNLDEEVNCNRFRKDLYQRLNVFKILLSGLRNDKKRIEVLTNSFIQKQNEKLNQKFKLNKDVLDLFYSYSWPGNIRELENVIEYATVICNDNLIFSKDLPEQFHFFNNFENTKFSQKRTVFQDHFENVIIPYTLNYHEAKKTFEKNFIEINLRKNFGKINKTSRHIGINKVSLIDKIKKYGIEKKTINL